MQLRKFIKVIPIIAVLAACVTPLTPEQRMANFANQCQAYGFKPQTDPYASCMMKLDAQAVLAEYLNELLFSMQII